MMSAYFFGFEAETGGEDSGRTVGLELATVGLGSLVGATTGNGTSSVLSV